MRGKRSRTTRGERIFTVFNYIFVTFLIVLMLYPFWHSLMASVSNPMKLLVHKGLLVLPTGFSLDAYTEVFKNPNILTGFKNTLIVLVTAVSMNIVLTLIAAYALSRKNFLYRKALSIFIIFTMFISGGLIPLYLVVYNLNLVNTRWAMILPTLINTYNIIITRTYMEGLPASLEESASLEGAGHMTILFRIIVPVSIPIIAVDVLFFAVFKWNGWFQPMIFLNKRELFPLQLLLREILIMNDLSSMTASVNVIDKEPVGETIQYATMMVSTLPIIMVYPFLQKYFVNGLTAGAIKE